MRAVTSEAMAAQFALNAIGPALVLKYFSPLLVKNRRSLMGFPVCTRGLSIGDKPAGRLDLLPRLEGGIEPDHPHPARIEIARTRPQSVVVSLHPGSVATSLSANFAAGHERFAPEESAGLLLSTLDRLSPENNAAFLPMTVP